MIRKRHVSTVILWLVLSCPIGTFAADIDASRITWDIECEGNSLQINNHRLKLSWQDQEVENIVLPIQDIKSITYNEALNIITLQLSTETVKFSPDKKYKSVLLNNLYKCLQ